MKKLVKRIAIIFATMYVLGVKNIVHGVIMTHQHSHLSLAMNYRQQLPVCKMA